VKTLIIAARVTRDLPVTTAVTAGERSFDRVYEDHVDFVWRSVRRLGVHEAAVEDVVQRVFLVVHQRLAGFEERSSLKTWLFSIVFHAVREHRRSVRRKSPHWLSQPTDPDGLADTATNPDEALEQAEASRVIDRLLESLEEDKRVVFVMAELEQLTAAEISQATGMEPKAVYSRLRAARVDFERAAARMRRDAATATRKMP
jgi:RNA polymerase sigma-70 factor (ECF subfamily)